MIKTDYYLVVLLILANFIRCYVLFPCKSILLYIVIEVMVVCLFDLFLFIGRPHGMQIVMSESGIYMIYQLYLIFRCDTRLTVWRRSCLVGWLESGRIVTMEG